MQRITLILLSIFFINGSALAQDQDFSQFYASPVTLNPALTGAFEGNFRVSFIYRDQWRSVLDEPVTTFSTTSDFRFHLWKDRSKNKDAAGFGIVFHKDSPGLSFSTNQILLSGAFHKGLSPRGNQYLSLGFQLGIAQRNTNYSTLNFNDQFNGTNGYTEATGEVFPENNFAYADYNVGINYSYAPSRRPQIFAGAAMSHITTPEVSFYYDEKDPEDFPSNRLHRKYSAYVNIVFPIGDYIKISPRALGYLQGPHFSANAGANFRFSLNSITGTALHLGSWGRLAGNEQKNIFADAVVFLAGIEYQNFLVGLSYDANISDLSNASQGRSTFEISLAYLGNYENDLVVCPKF
ncbi:MAG: type IX secretion system membrane protein PorP/SprF [Bacteroidetes bacterium]|nr:MAG: type IX secretion system membrane protein PorP/SprF [Bacteroidota bacterium]